MTAQEVNIAQRLFTGAGELGPLMMAKDWSKTSLGDIEEWPQSLVNKSLFLHFPPITPVKNGGLSVYL